MKIRLLRHVFIVALPFLFAGCFKTRNEIAREKEEVEVRSNLQQNIVEYNQSLERTQAELGRLQGRIEELEHTRRKEMQSGRESEQKTMEELRARIASLQENQGALFEEIKKLKEDNLALMGERARSAPPPAAKKKVTSPAASFDSALAAYKAQDFQSAANAFRAFIDSNPKGKRLLDAHYYLGDSLFREKEYSAAVVEFGVVHEKAPATSLGRQSTLKIAQSFKAMGKDKDAKAFAQLLVQASPSSKEAAQARKLLK
jgi:TolA-binding protein